ncbi:MAG TPA: RNA polymerase sigma factor [Acidimicrobiales bacterium]|nr:RNA polymerase sigma factor [Acidimicrobiales bacterium]
MIPFQVALDEHGPGLYRHLVGVLGPHDGADCYQETLLAALRAWPPSHDGNLRAWLFTIAHRKVIDQGRAAGRRAMPVAEVPEPVRAVAFASPGEPERDLDGGVWAAVRTLPEKQRMAVALRHGEDWGYADIAAVLECSEAAARQSVKAGLTRLKEVLA